MAYQNFRNRLASLIAGRNIQGLQSFQRFAPKTNFNNYQEEIEKLRVVMQNPAFLRVVKMKADLFSIGKIVEKTPNGEIVENSELQELLKYPNFFQNQKQFLWDYIFWKSLGNARLMIDSNTVRKDNVLYWLDSSKIEFPQKLLDAGDKLVLSEETFKDLEESNLKYHYDYGNEMNIPYRKVINYVDNTNGVGNWFNGFSTVETLFKVLSNSELALDAKNTNLNLAGQFMVSSTGGLDSAMMRNDDKEDIEGKIGKGGKNIHAIRTAIDIKRFVENIDHLKLDDSFNKDLQIIGSVYGIPRDALEAMESSKYENQQVARMSMVDYVLKPKAEDFCNGLVNYFGYKNKLEISWAHCDFMQVSEKERYDKEMKRATVFSELLDSGVSPEDAALLLDYNFENPVNYVAGSRNRNTQSQ